MQDEFRRHSPARLRALAEWYREFAALGAGADRYWPLKLAAHLEGLAEEQEKVWEIAALGPPK